MFTDRRVNFYMDSKIIGQMNPFFTSMECKTGRTILKQDISEKTGKFLTHRNVFRDLEGKQN